MKKKNENIIDNLAERLSETFAEIKDFDKLQESEEGRRLFNLIMKCTSELENFQALFLNYYIPASNKSIADNWNQIRNSKYRHLINISKDDLKDNLYETIRLGYVGLFHKYESYLKILVEVVDFLLMELNEENNLICIEDYCKKEFSLNIFKSHDLFPITKRINYISNCIKHWDGYPVKKPIHLDFIYSNPNKKIQIEMDEFKSDIESFKLHCQLLLSQIIMIGFKQYLELDYATIQQSLKPELKENDETKEKVELFRKDIEFLLSNFRK